MKVVIAQMKHETNTFSPVPTRLARFARGGGVPPQGKDAYAIYDPDAVQAMIRAGIGAELTLPLRGRLDMPSIGRKGEPRVVSGNVKLISDGRFRNRGPMGRGEQMDMGPTVVFDTGRVEIVVISRHQEPNDYACLLSAGIGPEAKRFLMLKSRVHWRAGFKPITKAIVACAGVGVCTSDYGMLDFKRVRRPIFPLDAMNAARNCRNAARHE